MPDNSNRNMIMFVVLAAAMLFGYQALVLEPQAKKMKAEQARQQAAATVAAATPGAPAIAGAAPPPMTIPVLTREQALGRSARVTINTPKLSGSISLLGARFDDLHLKAYKQALNEPDPVELLKPEGLGYAYYAVFGWNGPNVPATPGKDTVWTLASGTSLTPTTPVTLTYDNGAGLAFTRVISVDDQYVFSIADTVANTSAGPIAVAPYGVVQRQGFPITVGRTGIVHEGGIGVLGVDKPELKVPGELKYPKWEKTSTDLNFDSKGGWLGLTDKYWLTALIPDQAERLHTGFRSTAVTGGQIFDANYTGAPRTIAPGATAASTTHFFAGAKTVPILQAYQKSLGAPRFDDAVDWGIFWFFTRPIFIFLEFIFSHLGNFGVAILALTVCVKILFFPLANKSYESITKMKKLQPMMEEIKKLHGSDPAKQQQETMALYSREKINPLMGCLPMLVQIPVFYSLYKVLTVTIEMRQAPFFGFIRDLSARDPTTIWNLFGAIPWNPATAPLIGGFLDQSAHIGICAIIYGFTMWLTQSMNPPAPDPVQQKIFQFLPIIFTFTLSGFAVGLIVYWTWNNLLSILQQYIMMHKFGVDNPIDDVIGRLRGRPKAAP